MEGITTEKPDNNSGQKNDYNWIWLVLAIVITIILGSVAIYFISKQKPYDPKYLFY